VAASLRPRAFRVFRRILTDAEHDINSIDEHAIDALHTAHTLYANLI